MSKLVIKFNINYRSLPDSGKDIYPRLSEWVVVSERDSYVVLISKESGIGIKRYLGSVELADLFAKGDASPGTMERKRTPRGGNLLQEAKEFDIERQKVVLKEMTLDDVAYELADAGDISYGEAESFLDLQAYVIAQITKVSKDKILKAFVRTLNSDPTIVDRMAQLLDNRKDLEKLRTDIKDQKAWAGMIGFFRKTRILPPEFVNDLAKLFDR